MLGPIYLSKTVKIYTCNYFDQVVAESTKVYSHFNAQNLCHEKPILSIKSSLKPSKCPGPVQAFVKYAPATRWAGHVGASIFFIADSPEDASEWPTEFRD